MEQLTEFERDYKKYFKGNYGSQIIFEMGTNENPLAIVDEVEMKFENIANFLLTGRSVWLIIILWDSKQKSLEELKVAGFQYQDADEVYDDGNQQDIIGHPNVSAADTVLYLKYNHFDLEKVRPLIRAIASHELGIEPSSGSTSYLVSFDNSPVFLNLYDDRGLELIVHDSVLCQQTTKKFQQWVLRSDCAHSLENG